LVLGTVDGVIVSIGIVREAIPLVRGQLCRVEAAIDRSGLIEPEDGRVTAIDLKLKSLVQFLAACVEAVRAVVELIGHASVVSALALVKLLECDVVAVEGGICGPVRIQDVQDSIGRLGLNVSGTSDSLWRGGIRPEHLTRVKLYFKMGSKVLLVGGDAVAEKFGSCSPG